MATLIVVEIVVLVGALFIVTNDFAARLLAVASAVLVMAFVAGLAISPRVASRLSNRALLALGVSLAIAYLAFLVTLLL